VGSEGTGEGCGIHPADRFFYGDEIIIGPHRLRFQTIAESGTSHLK